MEYRTNPNYGRAKCFHCLLNPDRDDPIFIGINRIVTKGLQKNQKQGNPIVYPCPNSKEDQQQAQKIEIEKHILIDASPEVVFKAITDPMELTNWFPDQVVLEAMVGGKVKFSFYKEEGGHGNCSGAEGTIIEFIPNKKVSYTWEKHNTPDFPRTVVIWELEEIEDGRTRVNLLHTGFESGKLFKHDEGWSYFVDRLRKYCEK